ncbi:acyltransferase family protein [Ectobacillus funiculus]
MILVVAGHAYNHNDLITYIYWFHMPAFFLFSGYVSKPIEQWSQLGSYVKKRAYSLLVPYAIYLGLFTAARYLGEILHDNLSWQWYMKDIGGLLFGGRFITGYYGVFWFITCLFFYTSFISTHVPRLQKNKPIYYVFSFSMSFLILRDGM